MMGLQPEGEYREQQSRQLQAVYMIKLISWGRWEFDFDYELAKQEFKNKNLLKSIENMAFAIIYAQIALEFDELDLESVIRVDAGSFSFDKGEAAIKRCLIFVHHVGDQQGH